jgi:hypothetical protein
MKQDVKFVFLDESWVFQIGSQVRQCLLKSTSRVKVEDIQFLTLEVKMGFYLDVILYWTEVNDRDYHKTMNGELFEKWVVENLIAALRLLNSKCVVIMDNAPHHSIRLESPRTSASRKEEIKQ